MDKRYCVKFIRCDRAVPAVEEYYYWDRSDAETHLDMFSSDDPDYKEMYERIQLLTVCGNLSTVSKEICFH